MREHPTNDTPQGQEKEHYGTKLKHDNEPRTLRHKQGIRNFTKARHEC